MLLTDTFIFTYSLTNKYTLINHIRNPSSHYNHPFKLFITRTVNTLKPPTRISPSAKSKPTQTSLEMTRMINWPKRGAKQLCIVNNPFPPQCPSIPLISPHHDGSVRNMKNYIEEECVSALISHAKKDNTNIHIKCSNLFRDAPWNNDAQITQTLKFRYGRYLGNCRKKTYPQTTHISKR